MYISYVEIKNFRNFRHLKLNLGQYSVIVGANKSGKSNLLEAIRLAIDPELRNRDRKLQSSDFWDGQALPEEEMIVTITVKIKLLDDNEKNLMTNIGALSKP